MTLIVAVCTWLTGVIWWHVVVSVVGAVAVVGVVGVIVFVVVYMVRTPASLFAQSSAVVGRQDVVNVGARGPGIKHWRPYKYGDPQRVQRMRIDYVGHAMRSPKPWYYQRQPMSSAYPVEGSVRGLSARPRTGLFCGVPVPQQKQRRDLRTSPTDVPMQTFPSFRSRQPVSISSMLPRV